MPRKKKKKAIVCGFDLQMYECLSWLLEGKGFDQHIISVIESDYRHVISYLEWWKEYTVVHLKAVVK